MCIKVTTIVVDIWDGDVGLGGKGWLWRKISAEEAVYTKDERDGSVYVEILWRMMISEEEMWYNNCGGRDVG